MPRATRVHLPGHVWHITHRCHKREYLLRFAKDRKRWRHWLYVARVRYGLCVLNYIVTSNHIHLLVKDRGEGEIARSMQLVAGQTAQQYNRRRHRCGAFWEDRYHVTAVQTGRHLFRCLIYIDLNMVRAGVVAHPGEWRASGYFELCNPPQRRKAIDWDALLSLVGAATLDEMRASRNDAIEVSLADCAREPVWSSAVAIGDRQFLSCFRSSLGWRGTYKQIETWRDGEYLMDSAAASRAKTTPNSVH